MVETGIQPAGGQGGRSWAGTGKWRSWRLEDAIGGRGRLFLIAGSPGSARRGWRSTDTGDAVAGFGTGFGAGMTRADIIAGMQEETMLDRLPTLAELGNAAAFLASDRASGMTATLANVTCGAFLD